MKNLIGKRLDNRYEFLELIGVGGMANVYKSYDYLRKCYVAIKVLKEKYLRNEEFLYRFRNESKANASLSHPNIVRIFDVGFGNKMQYIVMEYVEGVTLKEYIENVKILNWKEAVRFTLQILRGLQHAHDKGIVHRDIKPQNIMLLEDGTVKIMDFGIARFPKDERTNFKKTIGSVHYISPEQAVGEITDFKSDVYSVGIMMYEMLTGKLPFTGKTPEIVAQKQISEQPKSPAFFNNTIPKGLVDIVFRAIEKNPQERYQSADEMLRDVDDFKKNPDISFGYSYLKDIEQTKYFGVSGGFSDNRYDLARKKSMFKNKKSKFVPIFFGVASAFLLVAVVMVATFIFGRGKKSVADIELPNFVGMNIEEVKVFDNGRYKDLGFTVTYEPSSKFAAGIIMEQSVRPGTQVKSNYSNINFLVSSGAQVKRLPDVVGLNVKEAEEKLKRMGFVNIKKVEKYDEKANFDVVLATKPKALEELAYDGQITLFCNVKREEKIIEVPNVVGKNLNEAVAELKDAGFNVAIRRINDPSKTFGVIISQNKNKGAVGSTVEIVLNSEKINVEYGVANNLPNNAGNSNNNNTSKKSNNSFSYSGSSSKGIVIPLKSSVKINDSFHVNVVDSFNNVVYEREYVPNKHESFNLNVDVSKNAEYTIFVKNNKTNKTAKYGVVKLFVDENGNCETSSSFSSTAFMKTLDD